MCLDAEDAASRITPKTAAICHVHIGGLVSRSALELRALCKERGLHFVEDACQAHGSSLDGEMAGALGTAAGFSFFSTKVMTTGEGGMVTTDDHSLVEKMKSIREFGKVKKGILTNYHTRWGYNWRMPEVAALLGLRQLASLDSFLQQRQEIASVYDEELGGLDSVEIIHPEVGSDHNYFKYIVVLRNHDRTRVHEGLVDGGVAPSGYVYELPLHKLPVFPEWNELSLPKTEYLCAQHICLPIFVGMSQEQARFAVGMLKKVLDDPSTRQA
jgi:dTDP-4-amino-4,6-dideoxygalactose transaminase